MFLTKREEPSESASILEMITPFLSASWKCGEKRSLKTSFSHMDTRRNYLCHGFSQDLPVMLSASVRLWAACHRKVREPILKPDLSASPCVPWQMLKKQSCNSCLIEGWIITYANAEVVMLKEMLCSCPKASCLNIIRYTDADRPCCRLQTLYFVSVPEYMLDSQQARCASVRLIITYQSSILC